MSSERPAAPGGSAASDGAGVLADVQGPVHVRARQDAMLGAIDVGLWYCDLPFDELVWDRTVKAHFWLPADARVTIDTFYARIHPEDRARTRAAIEGAIASHGPYDIEYRTVAPEGHPDAGAVRWVRAIGYTAYDAADRPLRFDGVTVDVTAREIARRERERLLAGMEAAHAAADLERRRLRATLDQLPVGVHVAEAPSGRLLMDNAALRAITGEAPASRAVADYSADYAGFYPAGHPRAGERLASAEWPLARTLATGAPITDDLVEVRRADGARRLVRISATPIRDAAGEVVGGVATVVDVTERERLLAEARESEARFRHMADAAPVMLWVTEADGRCTFLNRAWLAFTGQSLADGLGFGWLDAVHPDDAAAAERAFREATARAAPFRVEYRLRRHDGAYRRAVDAAAPRVGAGGAFLGYVGSVVDVEERAHLLDLAEAARAEAEAALGGAEAANRAKSEFLAVMSHELRTPLNAIGGYAELIELWIHGPVTDAQRTALERIQRSQRHLLGLIAGVLDYSRVEAGAVAYRLIDVPVAEAVAEAEVLVAPQLRAKGLGYGWSGAPAGLAVRADREKLQQVLLNLLGNAVKFTDARDGVPGRVEVACALVPSAQGRTQVRVPDADAPSAGTPAHAWVAISVRDTGDGIAPEQLARVFEPFVQANQRFTRPHDGIGLGLAISRDLARGMGGDLTAESTPGVGSTFTLTLPAT